MEKKIGEVIGEKIKKNRMQRGITQKELAKRSGISEQTVRDYELGKKSGGNIETLESILKVFKVTFEEFFSNESEDENNDSNSCNTEGKNIKKIKDIYYPKSEKMYEVSSLMELIVYWPLLDLRQIYCDLLPRIRGGIMGFEDYNAYTISSRIESIPDSPAKRYADDYVKHLHKIREGSSYEAVEGDRLNEQGDTFSENYKAYSKRIDDLNKYINDLYFFQQEAERFQIFEKDSNSFEKIKEL